MKRYYMLAAVLMAGLLVMGNVRAEEDEDDGDDQERCNDEEMQKLNLKDRMMDLQERQANIMFRNEMRKLDVELKRIEVEKQRNMLKGPMPQHMPAGGPGCEGPQAPRGPGFHPQGGQHQPSSDGRKAHCLLFMMICAVIHFLMAVWVYQDIKKRNAGSGIWVVVALLTGLLGTLVYAVVRLGDSKQA